MPIGSVCLGARAADRPDGRSAVRPVAASTGLRPVLSGTSTGRVLAVFPTAVYLEVGTGPAADVVALVASDGLRLPLAAVLAAGSAARPFAVHRAGDAVAVRDGDVLVGQVRYVPGRWWSPRRVVAGVPLAAAVRELGEALLATAPAHDVAVERALSSAAGELHAALLVQDPVGAARAAGSVLGLGPGLTPSGDDLLAGFLVTCHQLQGEAFAAELGRHITARAGAGTTALSAALLRCAAAGTAAPPVLDLVDAVAGRRPLRPALRALLAVGHTSGHDTARGVHLAAEVLLHRSAGAPPPSGAPIEEDS